MAVVYFTSNASTGAGSLAEAVENASLGDVVRPDEAVFERGATIEIALASTLMIDKNLTLDGGPFRVALNGGGSVACVAVANGATASFTSFDFIGGATSQNGGGLNVETGANVVLNRCRVCGCDAAQNGGGVCADNGATLEFNDGVIIGCRANVGGGVYLGATARFTVNGSTLALNVDAASNNGSGGFSDVVAAPGFDATPQTPLNAIVCNATSGGSTLYDATAAAENGSVVGVSSAEIGFVAAAGVSAPYASWSRDAWRDWDLRLLDDASDAPSPYRDSGDVDKMSRYDLQGNFRGRETNGVTTCSPGAYETIQADLFWIGRDATGAEVVSPSFLTSDGWAASRFADVSGDAAPQAGQNVFVDGDVSFVEFLSKVSNLTVGGGAVFASRGESISFSASKLQVGLGATFKSKFTSTRTSRVGAWARLTTFGAASATVDFDVATQADYFRVIAGELSTVPLYGRLELRPSWALGIKIAGRYDCSSLTVIHQDAVADLRIKAESATFRAKTMGFRRNSESPSDLFDAPVVVELYDAAEVTVPDGAPESWADAFEVDATDATSATLTLNGQTIYGDAPTADVSLTGSAKIDGANSLTVSALTLEEGATVEFANDASVILTTASATSATATGPGAFFAPVAAPEGLTLENGAVWCDTSANVTSLDVRPTSATTATFNVVKTNADANIVAQYSDDGGATWQTVATIANVDEYSLTVSQGADVTVRVAAAIGWLSETVSTATFLPVWTVSNGYEMVAGVSNVFEIATGGSNDGLNTYDFNNYGYL